MYRAVVLCLLLSLCLPAGVTAGEPSDPTTRSTSPDSPRIVAVLPNPVADGDAGEFVVLSVPRGAPNGTLTLTDGESTVAVPSVSADRVALTGNASAVTDVPYTVREYRGSLALANSGETLTLRRHGERVDEVTYADAPTAELLRVTDNESRWRHRGATALPVIEAGPDNVTAFTLPDAPGVPARVLAGAERRILLAGYTFASNRTTRQLVAAARRNATVRVLVDEDPVGGMSRRAAALLDRLAGAGVDVRVLGGEAPRYDFHHAKYAVVDDRALVTTENWKPSGTGGRANRGWGVVTAQPAVVEGLARVFAADRGWRDARPWRAADVDAADLERRPPANGSYPRRIEPATLPVEETRLLVAPDNAEARVTGLLDNATDSIRVLQVSLGSRRQPFLRAALRAADRGVDVRIALSSAWYVREENSDLVAWLERRAERDNLSLSAHLVDPDGRFEKVHAKGAVVDGEQVLLGSLNWNNNSARENREVALVLEGGAVASYFAETIASEGRAGPRRLGLGVGLAVLVAALLAVFRARRIRFGTR